MGRDKSRTASRYPAGIWIVLIAHGAAWIIAASFAFFFIGHELGASILFLGGLSVFLIFVALRWWEHRRWVEPLHVLARHLERLNDDPDHHWESPDIPQLADLARSIREIQTRVRKVVRQGIGDETIDRNLKESGEFQSLSLAHAATLTASGLFAPIDANRADAQGSPESSSTEYISRLHPVSLRWLDATPAEQSWLGFPLSVLKLRSYLELIHPDDRAEAETNLRNAITQREAYGLHYRIRTAKDEDRELVVDLSLRYKPDGTPCYIRLHSRDITDRVRSNQELHRKTAELTDLNGQLNRMNRDLEELANLYTDLYDHAPVMYFSLDRKCRFTRCNETFVRTLGYSREQLIGRSLTAIVQKEDRSGLPEWFENLQREGHVETETHWVKANGDVITVLLASTAVRKTDGSIAYSRSVARDETERARLKAELQVKNQRLEAANTELSRKNKELDEFSYGVSHDLQEPVRTLINFSDFLLSDYRDKLDATGVEYLQFLADSSKRLRSLIKDLLALSKAGLVVSQFETVDLASLLKVASSDLTASIRSKNVELLTEGELPPVWGDRTRILQLLENLLANGIKYNATENPRVVVSAQVRDDGMVETSIKDNGIGIPADQHQRIFELFRQLHPRGEYEGTGAGLAICRKIVEAHGGSIWVESPPEGGSIFRFLLPAPPASP